MNAPAQLKEFHRLVSSGRRLFNVVDIGVLATRVAERFELLSLRMTLGHSTAHAEPVLFEDSEWFAARIQRDASNFDALLQCAYRGAPLAVNGLPHACHFSTRPTTWHDNGVNRWPDGVWGAPSLRCHVIGTWGRLFPDFSAYRRWVSRIESRIDVNDLQDLRQRIGIRPDCGQDDHVRQAHIELEYPIYLSMHEASDDKTSVHFRTPLPATAWCVKWKSGSGMSAVMLSDTNGTASFTIPGQHDRLELNPLFGDFTFGKFYSTATPRPSRRVPPESAEHPSRESAHELQRHGIDLVAQQPTPKQHSVSLIDQTPDAVAWIAAERSARSTSSVYAAYLSGVAWVNTEHMELSPQAIDELISGIEDTPLSNGHDPGKRIGQVVAARMFETPSGTVFVGVILGLHSNATRLQFSDLGINPDPEVNAPRLSELAPADPAWTLHIEADPRDVSAHLIEAIANDSPLDIDIKTQSLNSADALLHLITLTLPFTALACPIALIADDLYQRIHGWVTRLWPRLTGRPGSVVCIQSTQRNCHVQFIFRGCDVTRLDRLHHNLSQAAAKAAHVIDGLLKTGLTPTSMTYECGGPQDRWYPSQVALLDGRLISEASLPSIEDLGSGLSVGMTIGTEASLQTGSITALNDVEGKRMTARALEDLASKNEIMATVSFLNLVGLKSEPPDIVLAALTRLNKLCARREAYVLNAPVGVVLVCPHEAGRPDALAVATSILSDWDVVPDLRIGVTSGKLSIVTDVDGITNAVGVPINSAARIATDSSNPGIAVHESYVQWADTTIVADSWLHERNRAPLSLTGKSHDSPYVCFVRAHPPRIPVRRHADVQAVPAVFLAYDLAGFSRGDLAALRSRFRSLAEIITRLKVSDSLQGSDFLLSPGGDGGVLVVCGSTLSVANAVYVSEQLRDWARAESSQLSPRRAVVPRIGVHYGQAVTFRNAYNMPRPTGRDLFIADDLAGDDAARRYAGVVMSKDIADAVANDSDDYLRAHFDELPRQSVRRYARKVDLIPTE